MHCIILPEANISITISKYIDSISILYVTIALEIFLILRI